MQTVVQKPNDPYIYLYVMGEWYCYNPTDPSAHLGEGAMGDVYRGYRIKDSSFVAVKRVKDSYANNKMIRERAQQEASLAFRHPNLVEMVGYCEYAPTYGPIFILSHYVNGENIDKFVTRLAEKPNRVEKICQLIYPVLDALDYVHSRGVVHRDIKPSNIMVENESNVRLMDLGIARMNGGNKFSVHGFIGTPEYSAPEQILREQDNANVHINSTTDVYALGITLYELIVGKNPMADESESETLMRQMKNPLPPDSKIPSKLMRVIRKATEKEQNRRYQSALEFKAAIKAAFEPDPTAWEKLKEKLEGKFVVLAFAISVLIVIMLLLIIII